MEVARGHVVHHGGLDHPTPDGGLCVELLQCGDKAFTCCIDPSFPLLIELVVVNRLIEFLTVVGTVMLVKTTVPARISLLKAVVESTGAFCRLLHTRGGYILHWVDRVLSFTAGREEILYEVHNESV